MKTQPPKVLNYSDIQVGSVHEFERVLTREDMRAFAGLTGDFNPLHMDEEWGRASKFGNNLVHGMLAGSLFSALIGMHCPGKHALYMSQTLKFNKPLLPGARLRVRGTVLFKSDSTRLVTLKTEIIAEDQVAVTGEAIASVLEGQ